MHLFVVSPFSLVRSFHQTLTGKNILNSFSHSKVTVFASWLLEKSIRNLSSIDTHTHTHTHSNKLSSFLFMKLTLMCLISQCFVCSFHTWSASSVLSLLSDHHLGLAPRQTAFRKNCCCLCSTFSCCKSRAPNLGANEHSKLL